MQEPADSFERPEPFQDGARQFPSIPGFRFQRQLGRGGMATVYLATQESLDRPVSIKVMEREALQDETSKQRFEHEARTIAKLSHAGIVGIHEVGRTSDGQMYYIMPYLANGDLSRRDLRDDETRIVDVLRTLLSALGYAHSHGIVHRDVKEENVLFDANNRPLLTDFGIALSTSDTSRITTAGFSVGSSGYMAPEQARGAEVDGRADLYSVGVLTFALLTGDLPFRTHDPFALALMHAQDAVPKLPPGKRHWQGFVDRAMAKSPAQRFGNAEQMLQALNSIERRSGKQFSNRMRRTLDRAIQVSAAKKRFRMLTLVGMLLTATGLYAAYQRFGAQSASVISVPLAPNPGTHPAPKSLPRLAAPTIPPAAAPPDTAPATPPQQTPPQPQQQPAQRAHMRTRHPVVRRRPIERRTWISRLFHRR